MNKGCRVAYLQINVFNYRYVMHAVRACITYNKETIKKTYTDSISNLVCLFREHLFITYLSYFNILANARKHLESHFSHILITIFPCTAHTSGEGVKQVLHTVNHEAV